MQEAPDQNVPAGAPEAQQPAPETVAAAEGAKAGAAYGSILGIILIVAVLVVGAFYLWGERLGDAQPMVPEDGVRGDTMPEGGLEGAAGVEVNAE